MNILQVKQTQRERGEGEEWPGGMRTGPGRRAGLSLRLGPRKGRKGEDAGQAGCICLLGRAASEGKKTWAQRREMATRAKTEMRGLSLLFSFSFFYSKSILKKITLKYF